MTENYFRPKKLFLIPNKFKFIGYALIIIGIALSVLRFQIGIKPDFLDVKVFAIYSSFIESNYFLVMTNNIFEEICGLIILTGFFMAAFSKEKEESENISQIRLYSFYYAFYINLVFLIFAQLFTFGFGFVRMLIYNMYSVMFIFIILFQLNLSKYRKSLNKK